MRRISIAGLMVMVLACGVATAALRGASDTWAGILLLATLGLLAFALLAIRQRREAARAFWEGFALFGWGYLVLTFGPWLAEQIGPRLPTTQLLGFLHGKLNPEPAAPQLQAVFAPYMNNAWVDLNATVAFDPNVPPGVVQPAQGPWLADLTRFPQPMSTPTLASSPVPAPAQPQLAWRVVNYVWPAGPGNLEHFQRVGQCLFALLAALLGGLLARRLYRTRPAEPTAG